MLKLLIKVSENGRYYTFSNNWNTDLSLSDKAYQNGFNYINDGVELCFGISKYGTHSYKLEYTIKGFVVTNDDSDMIYWTLVPHELSSKPDDVYIKIHSDFQYKDTLDVWGYGNYGGLAYVADGVIELSSNGVLESDEYMTVLVKFDKGTFKTSNVIKENFQYYHDMAEEGATSYVKEPLILRILSSIISFIFTFGFPILIFVISSIIVIKNKNKISKYEIDFGKEGRKINKDTPMFRDIPCNKDIFMAYWIAHSYNLMKNKTDFLGAILLKWLKEKKVTIEVKEGALFKKENAIIVFDVNLTSIENVYESRLYTYMCQASKDGRLESKEFEKWCSTNYKSILSWFDDVLEYETEKLIDTCLLVPVEKKTMFGTKKMYQVTDKLKQEAERMYGLKKFFKEFNNMEDKTAIEVALWEEYLMYAQIFGVAEKVAKQFKKLYPDVITDYSYDTVIFIHDISYSGIHSAGFADMQSKAESYSSGGGGFSSGGGGGGSFGGGGGGGGFR